MKIKFAKFANAVKVGKDEHVFIKDTDFKAELEGVVVRLEHIRSGSKANTSLFNTIYWVEDESGVADTTARGAREKKTPPVAKVN